VDDVNHPIKRWEGLESVDANVGVLNEKDAKWEPRHESVARAWGVTVSQEVGTSCGAHNPPGHWQEANALIRKARLDCNGKVKPR